MHLRKCVPVFKKISKIQIISVVEFKMNHGRLLKPRSFSCIRIQDMHRNVERLN